MNSRQGLGIGVALTLLVAMEGRLTAGAPSRGEGLAAWHQMYSVLARPRCINATQPRTIRSRAMTGIPTWSMSYADSKATTFLQGPARRVISERMARC